MKRNKTAVCREGFANQTGLSTKRGQRRTKHYEFFTSLEIIQNFARGSCPHRMGGMEKNAEHLLRKESAEDEAEEGLPLKGTNEAMKESVIYATFNLMYLIRSGD